jgi:hypothetical protein
VSGGWWRRACGRCGSTEHRVRRLARTVPAQEGTVWETVAYLCGPCMREVETLAGAINSPIALPAD